MTTGIITGLPTRPQVDLMVELFAHTCQPGRILTHVEISEAIDEPIGSSRYRGVLSAFRKRMFTEYQVDFRPITNVGIQSLEERERVTESVKDMSRGVRSISRSVRRISAVTVEKLPSADQSRVIHAQRVMSGTLAGLRGAAKEIGIRLLPTPSSPRAIPTQRPHEEQCTPATKTSQAE